MLLSIMEAPAPHVASFALRLLFGAVGSVFLYMSVFVFRDQQGRLQNRLENLWVTVMGAKDKYGAFVTQTAILTDRAANWVFGDKVFSVRAALISCYLAIASAFLLSSRAVLPGERMHFRLWGIFALMVAIAIIGLGKVRTPFYVAFLAPIISILVPIRNAEFWLLVFPAVGIVVDFLVIGINRVVVRKLTRNLQGTIVVLTLLYDAFWVSVFVFVWLTSYSNKLDPAKVLGVWPGWAGDLEVALFLTTSFTAIACAGLFLVALAAFLHKLMWPLLDNTMEAIAEFNILRNRKVQATLGTAFWLLARPSLGAWLKLFHLA
jgi:hypothetical protein